MQILGEDCPKILARILDSSSERIIYLGLDLKIKYANRAYREFHYEINGEIIGMHLSDIYSPELFESHADKFMEAASGNPIEFKACVTENGTSCHFHAKLVPNVNDDGTVDGIFWFCTDQTQQTLAERTFDSVLDGISGRVCLIDQNYKVLFANASMRAYYPAVNNKNALLPEILKKSNWQVARPNIELALTGQHVRYLDQLVTPQGEKEDLEIYLTPTRSVDQSTIEGVYILALDKTEITTAKSKLERVERSFELAAASQSVAFWEVNPTRNDWILTEHIEKLLGLSTGSLKNSIQLFMKRVHPSDSDQKLFCCSSDNGQGKSEAIEFRCRTATGEYHWFRSFGNRETDSNGKTLSLAGTIADINDLKNAEILAANRLKYRDSFLSMLSHELRNPVTGIQFAIDYFDDDEDALSVLSPGHKTSLNIIKRQTTVITRLLNDLLNVSRVSQDQIQFEEETLCFSELIHEVAESAKAIYHPKGQTLKVSCDVKSELITGDRVRLTQAFTNLIDNASKFSNQNSQIEVNCVVDGNIIATSVCDSGKGIIPEMVDNIYDLFFQGEQPLDRQASGLGVGLYLVNKIVNAHQGFVSVNSPGKLGGCDFEVRLPIQKSSPERHIKRPSGSAEKLVLVEDNEDARLALSMALTARGFDVTTFEEGQAAIDNIPNIAPSVVLIDIGLPGKDGLKVINDLRDKSTLKDTFFIALTGYGQKHEREMILAAGFHNHMVKPVDVKQICALVASRDIASI